MLTFNRKRIYIKKTIVNYCHGGKENSLNNILVQEDDPKFLIRSVGIKVSFGSRKYQKIWSKTNILELKIATEQDKHPLWVLAQFMRKCSVITDITVILFV